MQAQKENDLYSEIEARFRALNSSELGLQIVDQRGEHPSPQISGTVYLKVKYLASAFPVAGSLSEHLLQPQQIRLCAGRSMNMN